MCRFAEYAEGQLAAQSEEVAGLAAQREALQAHAARLADRHSRILERQEALNNRLSELARRICSESLNILFFPSWSWSAFEMLLSFP